MLGTAQRKVQSQRSHQSWGMDECSSQSQDGMFAFSMHLEGPGGDECLWHWVTLLQVRDSQQHQHLLPATGVSYDSEVLA